MSRLEKRLVAAALIFVAVYLGAIGLTLKARLGETPGGLRFESEQPLPGERHLMLAELFLPMMILLAISVGYVVAKKKRAKAHARLDDSDEEPPLEGTGHRPDP